MSIVAIIVDVLAFALAAFFFTYGVRAGIVERGILADYQGGNDTGRAAVARGVFYVLIGTYVLIGAIVLAASVVTHR